MSLHSLAKKKGARKVALLIETSNAYGRGLLQGIVGYVHEHQNWTVAFAEHSRGERPPPWFSRWKGDGVIARIETRSIATVLQQLRVPIVDVSAARLLPSLPWFETDDAAIAHLAADHFLGRGFVSFAYCGDPRFNWSNWREEHFQRALRVQGYPCEVYSPARSGNLDEDQQVADIASWLRKLRRPVGVLACYDMRGLQILNACHRAQLSVPDEVAVLGVDNDDVLCELASPPLSSIVPNCRRTGYEAAALLEQMMAGRRMAGGTHLIPPLGVATRQSTDVLAIADAKVVNAVRFIREHGCQGIHVQDVLKAVPQSRRLLEASFRKWLGRTPHEEIVRVQLKRVKELLVGTDLPLAEVAARAGFAHVEYLSVVFKNKVGIPPSRYRARNKR